MFKKQVLNSIIIENSDLSGKIDLVGCTYKDTGEIIWLALHVDIGQLERREGYDARTMTCSPVADSDLLKADWLSSLSEALGASGFQVNQYSLFQGNMKTRFEPMEFDNNLEALLYHLSLNVSNFDSVSLGVRNISEKIKSLLSENKEEPLSVSLSLR